MSGKKESMIEKIMNDPQPIPRKVPDYMRKKGGGWYWTGAMIMVVFIYEVLTGLFLLFFYEPTNAYGSTENFLNNTPFGSIIITTHLYGAYLMIGLIYVHLLRNLFVGAYKKPREFQWLTGLLLLVMTLGVAFFGYSMSGDVLSYDATDVGRGIAAGVPFIGTSLRGLFFGNGTDTSLFLYMRGWHIVLTVGIGMLFLIHFFMAEYNTIMPSGEDSKFKAPAIDKDDGTYKAWYPFNMVYMTQILFLVFGVLIIIPSILALLPGAPTLFSPFPQVSPSSPLAASVPSYPPWFLLFVYKALDFTMVQGIGPFWGTVIFAGFPLVYLFLLPYLDRKESLRIRDRPVTVSFGIIGTIYMIGLSIWGALTPGAAIPDEYVLLFFFVPGALVFLISYYSAKFMRDQKLQEGAEKIYLSIGVTGVASFGSGILILSSLASPSPLHLIGMILLLMVTAIGMAVTYAMIFGIRIKDREIQFKPMKKSSYTVTAGGFTMAAIVIFIEISIMPINSVFNDSLYGIGLGLIFLIVGAFIRLYRASIYGE
ncbi:MAG: cytochrome b [Thermoplasmataceae archaeon]